MMAYTPTSDIDETVRGGSAQWGRKYIQTRDAATVAGPLSGADLDSNGQPVSTYANNHIANNVSPRDWHTPSDDALWNTGTPSAPVKTVNDPCPVGWRVPTLAECRSIFKGDTEYDRLTAFGTATVNTWTPNSNGTRGVKISPDGGNTYTLFLPETGLRPYTGTSYGVADGHYWSSGSSRVISGGQYYFAEAFTFGIVSVIFSDHIESRAYGFPVRCIAE